MNLRRLYDEFGQSPWLDNLRRDSIVDGSLNAAIERGVRGLTSNPTIFQKAISSSTLYDEQFSRLVSSGASVEEAYWELVISDITAACDTFSAVYESSRGTDGFVSVEVSPSLCHDSAGTASAARELHRRIDRPNVMIKIPATDAGLSAITEVIASGISVNVTLIFGLSRYRQVMEAHRLGIERLAATDPHRLAATASVASFFISRVDNTVDPLLAASGLEAGRTAIAQARVAYREFVQLAAAMPWTTLAAKGAQEQRPLWASTSTKNPAFSPTLYVDELIGPRTVNTLPDSTLEAFAASGTLARTIDAGVDDAQSHIERVTDAGVDLESVAQQLEREGLASFQTSFDDLLAALSAKRSGR